MKNATQTWAQGLTFSPMTEPAALFIADEWKYPAPYDFYDATADDEDYTEFITPSKWPERFWQVRSEDQLIGFFTAHHVDNQSKYEISLGMRPDLTGNGLGHAFLQRCLRHLTDEVGPHQISLSVASFNHRAIKVYESVGFILTRTYSQPTNGGVYDFVEMTLGAPIKRT